ncbi:AcrR family transcriptional regulator [Actinoplanes tereljensis]|uniref:TetR family transcriptional regulator n=1 Tax=Paractinoplanes tereljensis TaxID=571912 RepID=A0A919NT44_9ACTN|nr:TetR/AcrR family transcriptional regulator [Actinoplanes tereljensis]GIF23863.1 TetR family transcriptional regulator [Actinoplanes tereljensis]
MTSSGGRVNRGPAAASENRQAILDSARRLFTERGYHVPLSAIAKDAGVGQGVLYRHFPTRLDLAFTVFEENFAQLEAIAADPGADAFGKLWERTIQLTVESAAFVEMAVDARRTMPDYTGGTRLQTLIQDTLPRAQAAGLIDARFTADDVLLAHRMIYGVIATAVDPAEVGPAVARARFLLSRPGA